LNTTEGNPNLSPERTNNYELGYTTYIKDNSFSLTTFIRNTTGSIQSVREVHGDTIRTNYQNIGQEDAYGFSFNTNINISNRFSIGGGTDIYYDIIRNNDPNPLYNAHNQGWVAGYRANASYDLKNGWALQAFGFYRGRLVQLQGFQGGFGVYSLNLKKDFGKNISLGVGADNLFTPSFYIPSTVNSPLINQSSMTVLHNLNIKINFSIKFGKLTGSDGGGGSRQPKKRKKLSAENDDMKEGSENSPAGGGGEGGSQGGGAPSGGGGRNGGQGQGGYGGQRGNNPSGTTSPDSSQKGNNPNWKQGGQKGNNPNGKPSDQKGYNPSGTTPPVSPTPSPTPTPPTPSDTKPQ
jgi:hypothetical protein